MCYRKTMSEQAIEFFSIFARLEYALKMTEAYRKKGEGGIVKADWGKFKKAPELKGLVEALRKDTRASRLMCSPPKSLMYKAKGVPDWGNQPDPVNNEAQLIEALKTARNNLFHGNKKGAGTEDDQVLLAAGLVVLDALIKRDKDVEFQFGAD